MNSRSWLISYGILTLVWGLSFAFNKQALTGFTPMQITLGRMGLGAVTLLAILAAARSLPRPSRTEWRHLIIMGTVGLALPFTLIAFAQTRVTSILAGLLNAATPLFTGLFISVLIPAEKPDRLQRIGLLVGFLGIGVLIGVWNLAGAGGADPVGVAAMIGATICYGFSTSFSRVTLSGSALSGTQLSAVQLLSGALLFLVLSPLDPAEPHGPITAPAVASLVALGALGTGLAMVLFWHVIRAAGSTVAATVTYAVPVVSTTVGVVLLSEPLAWNQIVGGVIVVIGVALTQWTQITGRGAPAREPAPAPE